MTNTPEMRFDFGKNWQRFIRRRFTAERLQLAKDVILEFAGPEALRGVDFLDIGCGSGLHSLAAREAGASRIFSFDYDPHSVATTMLLRERAGNPANWHVERGDILDLDYVGKLGQWRFVYCWGVLHHTGNVWQAIRNAQRTVGPDGTFYLSLYSADVVSAADQKFWLGKKQEYNRSGRLKRWWMQWWYIWAFILQKDVKRFPEFIELARSKRRRGMDLLSDIRDWLGGWPMEYVADQDVVDLLEQECGFQLANVVTGRACTEFLFRRIGSPKERTVVTAMVAAKDVAMGAHEHASVTG